MIPQIEPLIEQKDIEATTAYLNSGGWLTEHKVTEQFEAEIAKFVGSKYCNVVTSGTTGLILALMALGIGKGKRVALPVLTMIATANAVISVGAEPVFIDLNYQLPKNIDAVIHVSLNGYSSNIEGIYSECKLYNIPLIEDACQSLGSSCNGKKLGTFGDIGVYSFSPHKIITTGQGGAIVTNDKSLNRNISLLKDFGREQGGADFHPYFGINAKFTDLQASIGLSQLKSIESRIQRKRKIYDRYYCNFPDNIERIDNGETPWFVTIKVSDPEGLAAYLKEWGIATRPMYPLLSTQPIYKNYYNYPIAKKISEESLWLPSSLTLTDNQIDMICDNIKEWIDTKGEIYG